MIYFLRHSQAGLAALHKHGPQETIAVFTCATPIAIAAGVALQGTNKKVLEMVWVMYNAGVTTMKLRAETFHLNTLNAAPHLPTDELRTFC
jgi:hypothetical protein